MLLRDDLLGAYLLVGGLNVVSLVDRLPVQHRSAFRFALRSPTRTNLGTGVLPFIRDRGNLTRKVTWLLRQHSESTGLPPVSTGAGPSFFQGTATWSAASE